MPSTLNGLLKQGATIVKEAADELSVIRPILGQQIEQPVEESDGGAPRLGEPTIDERARITSLLGPAPRLDRRPGAVVAILAGNRSNRSAGSRDRRAAGAAPRRDGLAFVACRSCKLRG